MKRSHTVISKAVSIMLVLILSVGLTACGSGSNSSNEPENKPSNGGTATEEPAKNVELTFWNIWNGSDAYMGVLNDKVSEFQKENPNIKVKIEQMPHDQYKLKLKASAAGRQLPDMFVVWPGAELKPMVDGNTVLPIDDLAAEYKDKLIPSANLIDYQIDGKQYAIPNIVVYTHMIYYDKDILAKAGYSEFPKTYAEFKEMVVKVRDLGVTPIALGNKGQWVLQSCYISTIGDRMTGSDFLVKAMSGEKKFTDPEFVGGLNVIKELTDLKAFNEDMNTIDNNQHLDYFVQGKAAMFVEGTWSLGGVQEKLPKDRNLGLAIFPAVEGGAGNPQALSGVTGQGVAINKDIDPGKLDAARQFIRFLSSEDTYNRLLAKDQLVPATVTVPSDASDTLKQLISLTSGGVAPVYDAVLTPQLTEIINNGLQSITMGTKSPEEVASELEAAKAK
ncbi:extracellular solute-binding protein [Paenibacillus gorillae]|uniref:extracellular solute-binding protein n=1 Tax=Paenibacillus gorillae TaxID=1243662 RepID=UPI0005AABE5A|nr:extracellular solute-binding protein [Paenibacillus gorillae]